MDIILRYDLLFVNRLKKILSLNCLLRLLLFVHSNLFAPKYIIFNNLHSTIAILTLDKIMRIHLIGVAMPANHAKYCMLSINPKEGDRDRSIDR